MPAVILILVLFVIVQMLTWIENNLGVFIFLILFVLGIVVLLMKIWNNSISERAKANSELISFCCGKKKSETALRKKGLFLTIT